MAVADLLHLARRFVGSVRPGPPSVEDLAWARTLLADGEWQLFQRMSNPDRRHAVAVAREVGSELPDAPRPVMAAALLHDVGKVESELRTPARVMATLWWALVADDIADRWLDETGPRRRLAQYRRHPEIGEQLLLDAGADALTASWAGDHHKPRTRWRVDPHVGDVLKACDDD